MCFREQDGWVRVRNGIWIAISGCTYGLIGCFGMDFTGEAKEVATRIRAEIGRIGYHVNEVEK